MIRTEWTIQTRRTQSVMQKVSPRMTPLTRITGWVYKTSGGSKAVLLSPFNPTCHHLIIGRSEPRSLSEPVDFSLRSLKARAMRDTRSPSVARTLRDTRLIHTYSISLGILRYHYQSHRSPSVARTTVREGRSPSKVASLSKFCHFQLFYHFDYKGL